MKTAFLLLLFALSVAAQDVKYDKFKNQTIVTSDTDYVKYTKRSGIALQLSALLVFPGEQRNNGNGLLFLRLSSISSDWAFIRQRRLIVLADGERLDLGDGDRSSGDVTSTRMFGVHVREYLLFPVLSAELTKIVNAKEVEIQVAAFEGKLSEKQIKQIKAVLEYK